MSTEKNIRIRQRIDTSNNWENKGKLLKNEIGIDSQNRIIKYGTADNQAWDSASILYHPGESYVKWGGKNQTYQLNPIMSSFVNALSANRLNYYPLEYITIETSSDGGVTWSPIDDTASNRKKLFTSWAAFSLNYPIGLSSDNDWLRVNINSFHRSLYCIITSMVFQVSAPNTTWVQIETDKRGEWTVLQNWQQLTGDFGWNCVNLNERFGFADYGTNLRLTFKVTSRDLTKNPSYIYKIFLYAPNYWSNMGKPASSYGTPYVIDTSTDQLQYYDFGASYAKNTFFNAQGNVTLGSANRTVAIDTFDDQIPVEFIGTGLNMNCHTIKNVLNPVDDLDAVNKKYVEENSKWIVDKDTNNILPKNQDAVILIYSASYDDGQVVFTCYDDNLKNLDIEREVELKMYNNGVLNEEYSTTFTPSSIEGNTCATTQLQNGPWLNISPNSDWMGTLTQKGLYKKIGCLAVGKPATDWGDTFIPPYLQCESLFSVTDEDNNVRMKISRKITDGVYGGTTMDFVKISGGLFVPKEPPSSIFNVYGFASFGRRQNIFGNNDSSDCAVSQIIGNNNVINGAYNYILGDNNTTDNGNNAILGYCNDSSVVSGNNTLVGFNNYTEVKNSYLFGEGLSKYVENTTPNFSDHGYINTTIGSYNYPYNYNAIFEIGTGTDTDTRRTGLYIDTDNLTHLQVPDQPENATSPINTNYISAHIIGQDEPLATFCLPITNIYNNCSVNEECYCLDISDFTSEVGSYRISIYDTDIGYFANHCYLYDDDGETDTMTIWRVSLINTAYFSVKFVQRNTQIYAALTKVSDSSSLPSTLIFRIDKASRPNKATYIPQFDISNPFSFTAPTDYSDCIRENCVFFYDFQEDTSLMLYNCFNNLATNLDTSANGYRLFIVANSGAISYDSTPMNSLSTTTRYTGRYVYIFSQVENDNLHKLDSIYPSVLQMYSSLSSGNNVTRDEKGRISINSSYYTPQHLNNGLWTDFQELTGRSTGVIS